MKIEYVNAETHEILESLKIEKDFSASEIKTIQGFEEDEIFSLSIQFNEGLKHKFVSSDFSCIRLDMIHKMTILVKKP